MLVIKSIIWYNIDIVIGEVLNRCLRTQIGERRLPEDMEWLLHYRLNHLVAEPRLERSPDNPDETIVRMYLYNTWEDDLGKHRELIDNTEFFKNEDDDSDYIEYNERINRANRLIPLAERTKTVFVIGLAALSFLTVAKIVDNEPDNSSVEPPELKSSISNELSPGDSPLHSTGTLTNQSFIFDDNGVVIKLH